MPSSTKLTHAYLSNVVAKEWSPYIRWNVVRKKWQLLEDGNWNVIPTDNVTRIVHDKARELAGDSFNFAMVSGAMKLLKCDLFFEEIAEVDDSVWERL